MEHIWVIFDSRVWSEQCWHARLDTRTPARAISYIYNMINIYICMYYIILLFIIIIYIYTVCTSTIWSNISSTPLAALTTFHWIVFSCILGVVTSTSITVIHLDLCWIYVVQIPNFFHLFGSTQGSTSGGGPRWTALSRQQLLLELQWMVSWWCDLIHSTTSI
jgi:hypothetical protein